MQLMQYAEEHDGWFPRGEKCPEASLTLLTRMKPPSVDAGWIRGKTVPVEVVQQILDKGELLGPTTCGWNYIEGLRKDDSGELLLLWDKAGLGHNGQRINGRHVIMIQGRGETIPLDEWPAFLEKQRLMLAQLPKRDPQPRLPDNP